MYSGEEEEISVPDFRKAIPNNTIMVRGLAQHITENDVRAIVVFFLLIFNYPLFFVSLFPPNTNDVVGITRIPLLIEVASFILIPVYRGLSCLRLLPQTKFTSGFSFEVLSSKVFKDQRLNPKIKVSFQVLLKTSVFFFSLVGNIFFFS